jgi:hypothetical protein
MRKNIAVTAKIILICIGVAVFSVIGYFIYLNFFSPLSDLGRSGIHGGVQYVRVDGERQFERGGRMLSRAHGGHTVSTIKNDPERNFLYLAGVFPGSYHKGLFVREGHVIPSSGTVTAVFHSRIMRSAHTKDPADIENFIRIVYNERDSHHLSLDYITRYARSIFFAYENSPVTDIRIGHIAYKDGNWFFIGRDNFQKYHTRGIIYNGYGLIIDEECIVEMLECESMFWIQPASWRRRDLE